MKIYSVAFFDENHHLTKKYVAAKNLKDVKEKMKSKGKLLITTFSTTEITDHKIFWENLTTEEQNQFIDQMLNEII